MLSTKNKLTNSLLIATFSLCTLAACNSSDYKTDDDSTKDSTGVGLSNPTNPNTGAANNMGTDTMSAAAIPPSSTASSTEPSTNPAPKSATTSTVAKRKAKWSIKMPASGSMTKMEKDKDGVYNYAETMPQFPGGQNALDSYVNNNIDFPQQAIDDNTSGTIKVAFVIDEKGKVMKAHIIGTKLGNGLDEQALKVVSNMPTWKPGKVNGKNVKTRLELPIAFQVEA